MPNEQLQQIIVEYWDIPDENRAAFDEYYRATIIPSLEAIPGYVSTTMLDKRESGLHGIEGPRRVLVPHRGMSHLGRRTNFMLDYDALLDNEYNLVHMHFLVSSPTFRELGDAFTAGWEQVHPDWRTDNPDAEEPWDVLARDFFPLCRNHWDVVYDVRQVHVAQQ